MAVPTSLFPPFMKRLGTRFPQAPDPIVVDNSTRPSASDFEAGAYVWNTDDNAPNWSDGTDWRDAQGNIT